MCEAFSEVPFRPMSDSDDLNSLAPDMPYRHQFFWQTRHDHEPRQDSLCAVAAIRSVQPFRTSGRCLPGQQGGDGVLGQPTLAVLQRNPFAGRNQLQGTHIARRSWVFEVPQGQIIEPHCDLAPLSLRPSCTLACFCRGPGASAPQFNGLADIQLNRPLVVLRRS